MVEDDQVKKRQLAELEERRVKVKGMGGKELAKALVPAGATEVIQVDHGHAEPDALALSGKGKPLALDARRAGLLRLRVQPSHGSACRLALGELRHVAVASQGSPMTFIGGTRGPSYFHVPPGTPAFGVGLRTPDHHGRLRVLAPDGRTVLEERGDFVLGEEFRIDVPTGEDGSVWSLSIDKCEDCSLYLIDVPPYLSQRPSTLLTPKTP